MWISHHDFKACIKEWWEECDVEGWQGYRFMRKLKFLKGKLKQWNVEVFGDILKEIDELDRLKCAGMISLEQSQRRMDLKNSLEE